MINQVWKGCWADKVKSNALDAIYQYAEFSGQPVEPVKFIVFDNKEMYIPTPDMVKAFLYRVTKKVRARIMVALETSASAGETWRLTWSDLDLQNKTLKVVGVNVHKTSTYPISSELFGLLLQLQRKNERIFSSIFHPEHMSDRLNVYAKQLAKETGNENFKKIHFHTFRHYAISWFYFKTKDTFKTHSNLFC